MSLSHKRARLSYRRIARVWRRRRSTSRIGGVVDIMTNFRFRSRCADQELYARNAACVHWFHFSSYCIIIKSAVERSSTGRTLLSYINYHGSKRSGQPKYWNGNLSTDADVNRYPQTELERWSLIVELNNTRNLLRPPLLREFERKYILTLTTHLAATQLARHLHSPETLGSHSVQQSSAR